MPDQKISELSAIVTIDNATDVLPIVDTSATTTKKITLTQVKTSLALNNVDNTSDANKPVSTAQQTALDAKVTGNAAITGATKTKITYDAKGLVTAGADLAAGDMPSGIDATKISTGSISNAEFDYLNGLTDNIQTQFTGKQDTLVSATNIKTIEGQSLLGSGNIDLAKGDVGLGNVDNTSDANKPVSTATQTALDAKTNKLVTTNRQTASYTLVLGDADKLVEINNASANNLTVPLNSSVAFSTGTQILLAQYGAGQTTIVATSGVTIRSNGAKLKLNVQYSGATLIKIDTNEWYLFGDIAS
jgi:hypothetical protein